MSQEPMSDITQDDKLWAMLGYIIDRHRCSFHGR